LKPFTLCCRNIPAVTLLALKLFKTKEPGGISPLALDAPTMFKLTRAAGGMSPPASRAWRAYSFTTASGQRLG